MTVNFNNAYQNYYYNQGNINYNNNGHQQWKLADITRIAQSDTFQFVSGLFFGGNNKEEADKKTVSLDQFKGTKFSVFGDGGTILTKDASPSQVKRVKVETEDGYIPYTLKDGKWVEGTEVITETEKKEKPEKKNSSLNSNSAV